MRHITTFLLFFFIICNIVQSIAVTTLSTIDNLENSDGVSSLKIDLNHFIDSITVVVSKNNDSINTDFKKYIIGSRNIINNVLDSFKISNKDSPDSKTIDSLSNLTKKLEIRLFTLSDSLDYVTNIYNKDLFSQIYSIKEIISKGNSELDKEDLDDTLQSFKDTIENLCDIYADTLNATNDNLKEVIDNIIIDFRDEIKGMAEDIKDKLLEEQLYELEKMELKADSIEHSLDKATRLEIGSAYNNHFSYRGRDDGVSQYCLSPSLLFKHQTGISINTQTYWISKAKQHFDETDLGISYDYDFNEDFHLSIGYSHFWFGNTSNLSRSLLNNNFEIAATISYQGFEFNPSVSIDFETKKEINLLFSIDYPIEIKNIIGARKISFIPTCSYIAGEQLYDLTVIRKLKKNKIKVITSSHDIFGVMDYEFSFVLS